ncbi:GHKL domain-containing protein [Aerococcaceae bacterium WGS1372]
MQRTLVYDGIIKKQGQQILTCKEDASIHGFGLKSVKRIVEKYHGFQRIDSTQETFTVSIILNETF